MGRTALQVAREAEEEKQRLEDFKLQKDSARAAEQQEMETKKVEHELGLQRKRAEGENAVKRLEMDMEFERLKNIKSLDKDGDMAKYLIAKDCQLPPIFQCGTVMSTSELAATVKGSDPVSK